MRRTYVESTIYHINLSKVLHIWDSGINEAETLANMAFRVENAPVPSLVLTNLFLYPNG
jgi:hypothetical protein